jgi:predicted porin
MKKINLLIILILGLCISGAYAEEEQIPSPDGEYTESVQSEHYVFPDIRPEMSLSGGYRYVHLNGSSDAAEFEYLHDSLMLGGEVRTVSLNHRLHLDLEVINKKDFNGDFSYAYKDLVLFRGVNSTFFHNLDNILLEPFLPAFPVAINDAGETYGVKVGISNMYLRLKAPDFPAHLYFEGNFIDKDGTSQQRFLGGSGYFNDRTRVSEKRNIDTQLRVYTVGGNSHLGPVEVDLSHSEKRFDVSDDQVLIYNYTASANRTAGDYDHNLIPELKSSTNTLKLHTSYTGGLVATATLSKTDNENRYSSAETDYLFVAGDVTWMPMTALTFFLKYRHQERDVDNPDSVRVQNLTTGEIFPPLTNPPYSVRNSISSIGDAVSGAVRYRPVRGVMLKADYTYEDIRRNDVEDWFTIPDSTQRQRLSLSGDVRIMANMKLRAKYTHRDINNPATNAEPDHSDEGLLTLSWTPLPGLNALISYDLEKEKRKDLKFVSGNPETVYDANNRKVKNDRLIGTVSYALLSNLLATASYAYIHYNVRQDIRLNATDQNFWDDLVPYKTTARNYSLALNYSPKSFISLNGGISNTVSQGTFYTSAPALDSMASFSELKIRETTYSAAGEYQFKGGFAAGIQYRYSTFNDLVDNPYDGVSDGRAGIVLLTLSKKW